MLLRIYERENLFLAEYGKLVQQLQGFDLPSLRKQLTAMAKTVSDGKQRQSDLARSVRDNERKFAEECQRLGIPATLDAGALEREVIRTVRGLPARFKEIEVELKKEKTLALAVGYYRVFSGDTKALSLLEFMAREGDRNVAYWKGGDEAREKHKYDLYERFDRIVYGEKEDDGGANKEIEIDWSKVDYSAADWDTNVSSTTQVG